MGNQVVALNQEDVSIRIRVLDDADGTPYTGLVDTTTGHEIWYQRGFDNAAVTDGGSANDHAAIGDAHTDWEFIHIREGWYRVDIPDAAFLEGVGSVTCGMNATGYTGISVTVDIEPLFKYQGLAGSVTATTTTFPSATTVPLVGDIIMVVDGQGDIGNQVLVTSVNGLEATHVAFETGISATTTTILLIAGDAITARGGSNVDELTSAAATPLEVNVECDQALSDADLATASNLALIDGRIPTALVGGAMDSDIRAIQNNAITSASIATDAITASAIATDAITEINAGTWTQVLGNTTLSASALMQIIAGVAAGKISGAATTSVTIRDIEDSANMIVATVDSDGNRSAITLTTPAD